MRKIASYRQVVFSVFVMGLLSFFLNGCTPRDIRDVPVTQANVSDATVLMWSNEALVTIFNTNYATYQQNLQNASRYFTPEGWTAYQAALRASGNLNAIVEKRFVVSAVAAGAPIILTEGLFNGRYIWQVQMPLLVTYQNASETHQQSVIATMIIVRTLKNIGVGGLAIHQIVITPRSPLVKAQ